jgi:hypothetical protein
MHSKYESFLFRIFDIYHGIKCGKSVLKYVCIFFLVIMITGFNSVLLLYDGYRAFTGVKRPERGPAHLLSSKAEEANVLHLYLRHPSVPAQACYGVTFVFTIICYYNMNL